MALDEASGVGVGQPFASLSLTLWVVLLSVSFVFICIGLLYIYQDYLLYYPTMPGISKLPETNPKGYRSPLEHNLPFEDMYIKTEDNVVLHSWLILQKPDPQNHPTVRYCQPHRHALKHV
jgi:hypothetical protein